jgi:hypothetical protein
MNDAHLSSQGSSTTRDSNDWESASEGESILPSQFFEGRTKREALEPLNRLMLAILVDAVRCYQAGSEARTISRRRAFREAEEWLFTTKAYGPFSFERVCQVLDITPDYLRKGVRKWGAGTIRGVRVTSIRRSTIGVS